MGLLRRIARSLRRAWDTVRRFFGRGSSGDAGASRPSRPPEGWLGKLGWKAVREWLWGKRLQIQIEPDEDEYDPVERVHPVPPVALGLQKAAAGAFFEALGLTYFPGVLVEHLRQYDVSFALWSFCEEFHLRFNELANPESPDHARNRDRLEIIFGILVDAEEAVHDTPLSGQPVVDALRRSVPEAERLIDRLHLAVDVWRELNAKTVEWPRFVQFRDAATVTLSDWAAQDHATLGEIRTGAAEFQALRDQFSVAEAEIRRLVPDLRWSDDPEVRGLVESMAGMAAAVIDGVTQGRLDPAAGVDELHDVLTVLRHLAQEAAPPPPDPRAELRRCLAVLGLAPGADRKAAKAAYRPLAMRYHPDHNKSPDAMERFREIQEAYEFIRRHLP